MMVVSGSRLRQLGWAMALGLCMMLFLALTFKVNAVKSDVRLAERQIISLQRQKIMLETEFQSRASQQQLAAWNAVDFGYQAPRAEQYLENERQLASLGMPRLPGSPEPIRVAQADPAPPQDEGVFPAMVSPLTGQALAAELPPAHRPHRASGRSLAERLATGVSVEVAEIAE